MLKNENGFVIVVALGILVILTLTATLGIRTAITEQHISTNSLIYKMNFYSAESGVNIAPLWVKANLTKDDYKNSAWLGSFEGTLNNGTAYSTEIAHIVNEAGEVLLYGDEDGDYMWEVNTTVGIPLERATATGTHIGRGGESVIQTTFRPLPPFVLPEAALWVHSNVNGNGVSGSIVGEGPSDSTLFGKAYYDSDYDCPAVPDVKYQDVMHNIEYDGNTGESYHEELAGGLYPMGLLLPNLKKRADYYIDSISGNKLPAEVDFSGQRIVYIDVADAKLSQNITGSGILVVNGDFEISGNLSWEGLILVNGDITFNGGGASNSTMVTGSVVSIGNAVAINGSVDIIYDCRILDNLFDDYMSYSRLSWRQL